MGGKGIDRSAIVRAFYVLDTSLQKERGITCNLEKAFLDALLNSGGLRARSRCTTWIAFWTNLTKAISLP
jgi:hypothetical protein